MEEEHRKCVLELLSEEVFSELFCPVVFIFDQ